MFPPRPSLPLKVAHVIPSMDPETGGPPAVVAALTTVLRDLGVESSVVSYEKPDAADRIRGLFHPGALPRLAPLPPITRWELPTARNARRLLPDLLKGHDLVHLHGVWDPVILAASKAAKRLGLPYVIRTAGMLEPWAVERKPWRKRLFLAAGWSTMLRDAAVIQDFHPGPVRILGRTYPTPVSVIPNGVFPPTTSVPRDHEPGWRRLLTRLPAIEGKRHVLFLARLDEQKAPEQLVEAFASIAARHPDVVLLMAGPDYGLEPLVRRVVERHRLADRVLLAGPLYGSEKAAALARAEIFALPSRHEGFSVAVLEAMLAGLPCLITDNCHFERAGEVGAAAIVPTRGRRDFHGDLAAALGRLLSDPAGSAAMGERARELVLAEYTWPAVAAQVAAMYKDILAPRRT